jgi:carboxyl-terminal processing protease
MMKFKSPLFFSVAMIGIFVASYMPYVNVGEKDNIRLQTLMGGINQLHYSPEKIDDKFSKEVFDLYMERLDGGRRWFTQSEVNMLKAYELSLDEAVANPNYEFFEKSVELKKAALERAQRIYREILDAPFDFSITEDVELDGDKKAFAKNEAELKEYWRKSMKYDVMTRLADQLEKQEKARDAGEVKKEDKDGEAKTAEAIEKEIKEREELLAKTKEEIEAESREKTLERYDDWFERLNQERRSDYMSTYLNAIANVFDPHTSYYLPKDKENFDINMSGTLEGIGARLQQGDEYTKVVSIIPGGPAWKGKELEVEDLITKVTQGGDSTEEPLDVTGLRLDDVVEKIRGKKGTEVILTVKRVDGSTKEISIVRDVVILDEGYAKSATLDYSDVVDNIGYVKLPRFYADFNRRGGKSCAVDVAKEIEKLNAKNVNGIILDLRNNGGGSLRDVVTMSGLFIEEGPIVQVKKRDRKAEVLTDDDASVLYDGPLIVMVNEFSASASEILAAALQDYGRAVIVGSNNTFGKGTVQRFFDLDSAIRGNEDVKPLGEVKLTIQKFYRINGGSTQLKGVTPDIILPDNFTYIPTGEQDNEYAMPWTEIPAVDYSQNVYKVNNIANLKSKSAKRVANNDVFIKVDENAKRLKTQRDDTNSTLSIENYKKEVKTLEEEAKKYKDMFQPIDALHVNNLEVDLAEINVDEAKKARNDDWLESIQKDVYIQEALNIMKDMQEQQ